MSKILTTADLAKLLRLTPYTIRVYRSLEANNSQLRGGLLPPGFRIGAHGQWRYRLADVEAWIATKASEALASASTSATEGQQA